MASLTKSPDELFQQFIDIQKNHLELDDNEELVQEFEIMTHAHLQVLTNLRSKQSLTEEDALICRKLEIMLKEERNTWRLTKSLLREQLLTGEKLTNSSADLHHHNNLQQQQQNAHNNSDLMDDSDDAGDRPPLAQNGHDAYSNGRNGGTALDLVPAPHPKMSEDRFIVLLYMKDNETKRMQLVVDWLEANERDEIDYRDEHDKAEFYFEGPTAWENTFHAMRAKYNIDLPEFDTTINPNAGVELCTAMDPDAPIRSKKFLVHLDKEIEIRLFKHFFRFIRAGKLQEGQELARRVGYYWMSAALEGWLPYRDPNLDEENLGPASIHEPSEVEPVSGNKKRDIWKRTCYFSSKIQGLTSFEKAIFGVFGGNLKTVLPVCNSWSDQLWARLKCSIEVKIEKALRDPKFMPQDCRTLVEFPEEFYNNFQGFNSIFNSIRDLKIISPYREATIHHTIQRYLILDDVDGLLGQLLDWCRTLEYDNNLSKESESISPHFLRCFAHMVLFLRDERLVSGDDARATKILESYIKLLIQERLIESVAHYTVHLPRDNQINVYAKLLATIDDREERKHCLKIAKEFNLDIDEITQTVVELILNEPATDSVGARLQQQQQQRPHQSFQPQYHSPGSRSNASFSPLMNHASKNFMESTKTTASDQRKINSLDYLLYLESKNYIAILHHGNILLRHFALQRKMDAVKETYLKLPLDLSECVETQWRLHTNNNITLGLRNNIRELMAFKVLLETQEELTQWSEWHHKRPEEPRKPANLTKFCDNVNYEQRLKQYQQDVTIWKGQREARTNALTEKIFELFSFSGGWMKDLPGGNSPVGEEEADELIHASHADDSVRSALPNATLVNNQRSGRLKQLDQLRKIFVPHKTTICFNVFQLTGRYEDCLKVSHWLASDELKLYEEFTKDQIRDFLDKISEVTKMIVKRTLASEAV